MTTFAVVTQSHSSMRSSRDLRYTSNDVQPQQSLETLIHVPEAMYNADTGSIQCSPDMDLAFIDASYSSDEEMLATMQAIKNPSWWQNMMMPG